MISVTILAKNSESTIKKTLESLKKFPEVLVIDTGSTDSTCQIASAYPNTKVVSLPFNGFGKTHNTALEHTRFDWILSIDSDEALSQELADEILKSSLENNCVYSFLRKNFFQGKHIRCCSGWHPDWIIRLFNKKVTRFSDDEVHEKVLKENLKVIEFKNPIFHIPYQQIADFINKMQTYSALFAKMYAGKKNSSTFRALYHALFAFIKSFFLKKGFLGGSQGLIISLYNAHVTWYKYLKLDEANKSLAKRVKK